MKIPSSGGKEVVLGPMFFFKDRLGTPSQIDGGVGELGGKGGDPILEGLRDCLMALNLSSSSLSNRALAAANC